MPLDPQRLFDYRIPDVDQTYSARDTAFYALSVGMGQDPLDRDQLRFVDPAADMPALPTMAVVLGYPGFWQANPDTGIDTSKLVHGEQKLVLHRPLPPSGRIIGKTRVTRLLDKGTGKGALLSSTRTLVDAASGELLAETVNTSFIRGEGGFGGDTSRPEAPIPVPDSAPDFTVEHTVRPEQALYYRLNGDYNRIHADPDAATKAGFSRPLLHGLCTMGMACAAVLGALCDYRPERFRAVQVRFTAPTFPGDTLQTEIWRNGAFRVRSLASNQVVIDNGFCTRV